MSDMATIGVTVRPAAADDIPYVLALYVQPGMDDTALPLGEAKAIFDRMALYPDYTLMVAEEKGRVIGTFALLVMDNLGHLGAKSAVVEDVVVDHRQQGRGIGKIMMQYAMLRASESGCYKMTLSSNLKRTLAHKFYEDLGFRHHGYSFWIDLPTGEYSR